MFYFGLVMFIRYEDVEPPLDQIKNQHFNVLRIIIILYTYLNQSRDFNYIKLCKYKILILKGK